MKIQLSTNATGQHISGVALAPTENPGELALMDEKGVMLMTIDKSEIVGIYDDAFAPESKAEAV